MLRSIGLSTESMSKHRPSDQLGINLKLLISETLSQMVNLWHGQQVDKTQFSLAHLMINELVATVNLAAAESDEQAELIKTLENQLERLLVHQLEVFVAESQQLPIQKPYWLEISATDSKKVSLYDTRYPSPRDIKQMSQLAADSADNAVEAERYDLETRQVQAIYEQIENIIYSSNLTPQPAPREFIDSLFRDGLVSSEVELNNRFSSISSNTDQLELIGDRWFYTLPSHPLYPGDKAYLNLCQVVRVVGQQDGGPNGQSDKYFLLVEPFFYDFSDAQLRVIHNLCRREKLIDEQPRNVARNTTKQARPVGLSQDELLTALSFIPQALQSKFGYEFFKEFFNKVGQEIFNESNHTEIKLAELLTSQQRVMATVNHARGQLQKGAVFLAKILLLETSQISHQGVSHFSGTSGDPLQLSAESTVISHLPARLNFAFGLVVSPLVQGKQFDPDQAQRAYLRAFGGEISFKDYSLTNSDEIKIDLRSISPEMLVYLSSPDFLRQCRRVKIDRQQKKNYQRGLEILPLFYQNPIVSNSMCSLFSFGNFADRFSTLQTASAQQVMGGMPVFDKQIVARLSGSAEGWHLGQCIHPNCANKDKTQLVGPCGICLSCQLKMESSELAQWQNKMAGLGLGGEVETGHAGLPASVTGAIDNSARLIQDTLAGTMLGANDFLVGLLSDRVWEGQGAWGASAPGAYHR